MTVCVRVGCSRPLPDVAVKNEDAWCSRKCSELDHGVTMAADLGSGGGTGRSYGGVGDARTRLQQEAATRSAEAWVRILAEERARTERTGGRSE